MGLGSAYAYWLVCALVSVSAYAYGSACALVSVSESWSAWCPQQTVGLSTSKG
jgi:hypothetical protein